MFGDKRAQEEKKAENLQKFIERYDLEALSEDDARELYDVHKTATFSYAQGLIAQNIIIIKLLNRINNNLEELKNK